MKKRWLLRSALTSAISIQFVLGLRQTALWLSALSWVLLPASARAELTTTVAVTGQYESNSNVYDLQHGYPVPATNDYQHSDTDYAYGGIIQLRYLWSQQAFYASATGHDYRYDHFTQLDHSDYKLNGGLDWKLGSILDGNIDVLRSKTMVPFTDVTQSLLALETEQRESGKIGLLFASDWRVEGSGYTRMVMEPLVGSPNLQLTESSGIVAFKFIGNAGLTAGLDGGYLSGDYAGAVATDNPSYRQTMVGLVANYDASGHSTFLGQAGYSHRTSGTGIDNASGPTGELDYTNQLTAKTSVKLGLNRVINSYIFNTGSEIDTNATVTVNWQATYKLGVIAGYVWTYRELPGQGNAPVGSDRFDHVQFVSLNLDYEALRWLAIKPYASVLTRNSDFVGGGFNATVYGISATVQWQK
jgi:hypothetical protein